MKRAINYDHYLRLCGLLALAEDRRRELKQIERSARRIVGEEEGGHVVDAVWGGYEMNAAQLLAKLDIPVPSAPREEGVV